jgi:hypothetical protein
MKRKPYQRILYIACTILFLFILIEKAVIATDQNAKTETCPVGDINSDCQIGLEEAIIVLKVVAGFTNALTNTHSPDCKEATDESTTTATNPEDQAQSMLTDLSGVVEFIESLNISEVGLASIVMSMLNDADIPCGKLFVESFYPFKASFRFDGSEKCFGISGSVQLESNIFDTTAYLTFDQISVEPYSIDGHAIASIATENGGYKATLSTDSFLICGHHLSGFLFATNNDLSDKVLQVGMKGTDHFQFEKNEIKLEADLTYSHKGGANGMVKAIINNEMIIISFQDFVIDLKNLAPVSGVMKINGTVVNFGF